MRELKFRLIKDNKIVGYESHIIDPDLNIGIGIYHKSADEKILKYGYPVTGGDKNYIFHDKKEQYSDYEDMNKKLICEGDILENNDYTRGIYRYIVEFKNAAFWIRSLHEICPESCSLFYAFNLSGKYIIGNKYENPELLEKII